jgi:maleate isomerase
MADRELNAILVVPDTNTTMEPELRALWPEITRLQRVGVPRPMRPIVVGDLPEYRANTLKAVQALLPCKVDVVIYGCTTAGFLAGPAGDKEVGQALSELTGAPAVTTASAMVQALRHSGVRRPAIVTPYLEASNDGLKRFLAAMDMEVPLLNSFFFHTVEEYNNATREQVRELAMKTGADDSADGLFIACTQLPTLGILEDLANKLGKPVRGAIEATVWAAKEAIGFKAQAAQPHA